MSLSALFVLSLTVVLQERADTNHVSTVDVASLYAAACATCHGRDGDGKGRSARLLGRPAPRDFTAGLFKFQSTASGSPPTDADLYRTISRGVPGTWMPAWERHLTSAERWALVRYIKGYSSLLESGDQAAPLEIPADVPPSPELVREGRFVYVMLQCAKCHGPSGRGNGPSSAKLKDDWGAPIHPADFTRGIYRGGNASSDIYRTLVTGIGGTPMPALEPAAVAFPAKTDAPLRDSTDGNLRDYLAAQPSAAEIARLAPEGLRELVERRLWALVHYLRSLKQ